MSDVSSDSPEADAVSSHSESPPLARGDKWAYTEYGASPPGNGLSSRKANPQPPSTAVLADFEAEFHEFYTRAWAAGVRAKDLSQWAPKVAAAASEGEVKYILLNGCYGGKKFDPELCRIIDSVQAEVDSGAITFDPDDDHGILIESLLNLGRDVDAKLREERAREGRPLEDDEFIDVEERGGWPRSPWGRSHAFEGEEVEHSPWGPAYDEGEAGVAPVEKGPRRERSERDEKKRLLRLGLNAGGSDTQLYFVEMPLKADWSVSEYDGIESLALI